MKKLIIILFLLVFSSCAVYRIVSPPAEYGTLKDFEGKKPKIILLPFYGFLLKGKYYKNSSDYYPVADMSYWMFNHIKDNCSVIYPDSSKNYFNDTLSAEYKASIDLVNTLMASVFTNPDSAKYWKAAINNELIDTNTYFLFPFTIERIENDEYEPNFWTVVADNKGKVVFARGTSFKPRMWAKSYTYFRDHTHDIIPFGK